MVIDRIAAWGATAAGGRNSKTGLTRETAFETLSSMRRRYVLHYLLQEDRPVALKDLSTQIAAWENGTDRDEVTYKERMRAYTALRQSHLPRMSEHGVVRFDEELSVVELTPEASELEVYLDVVPHDTIPWSTYYAGLSVLSLGLVAVSAIDLVPFDLLPDIAWAALVALAFAASSAVHVLRDRKMRIGRDGPPPTREGEGP